jgi:hypothetical protein
MTIIRKFLLYLLFAGISIESTGQQLIFERKYEGINILPPCFRYQRALPVQLSELADGSILILGNSYCKDTCGVYASETYHDLKKLDNQGNVIWTQYIRPDTIFSNNVWISLSSFQVLDNGNILLIGEKQGSMLGARVVHLILLDSSGEHLFDTSYTNSFTNYIYTVPQGSARCGNGFAVVGETFIPWGAKEAYVMKLNHLYEKEWEFKLGQSNSAYSVFHRIIANADGTFDCFGNFRMPSTGRDAPMFLRLNANGQQIMMRTYDDPISDIPLMDAIAGPGYRLMLGRYFDTCFHPILIKTDENGNEFWRKIYPVAPGTGIFPNALTVNQQNEFLVSGEKDISDSANQIWESSDIYLLKTDYDGNKVWDVSYGTSITRDSSSWACWEFGADVVCSNDGRYLVLGDDNINNTYGPVMSVLKIAEGMVGYPNISHNEIRLAIFPCPVPEQSTVTLKTGPLHTDQGYAPGDGTFSLYDVTGQLVVRIKNIHSEQFVLKRDGLPCGIYFFSFEDGQHRLASGKLIFN